MPPKKKPTKPAKKKPTVGSKKSVAHGHATMTQSGHVKKDLHHIGGGQYKTTQEFATAARQHGFHVPTNFGHTHAAKLAAKARPHIQQGGSWRSFWHGLKHIAKKIGHGVASVFHTATGALNEVHQATGAPIPLPI